LNKQSQKKEPLQKDKQESLESLHDTSAASDTITTNHGQNQIFEDNNSISSNKNENNINNTTTNNNNVKYNYDACITMR